MKQKLASHVLSTRAKNILNNSGIKLDKNAVANSILERIIHPNSKGPYRCRPGKKTYSEICEWAGIELPIDDKHITIKLTAAEYKRVKSSAEAEWMTISEFIRGRVLR